MFDWRDKGGLLAHEYVNLSRFHDLHCAQNFQILSVISRFVNIFFSKSILHNRNGSDEKSKKMYKFMSLGAIKETFFSFTYNKYYYTDTFSHAKQISIKSLFYEFPLVDGFCYIFHARWLSIDSLYCASSYSLFSSLTIGAKINWLPFKLCRKYKNTKHSHTRERKKKFSGDDWLYIDSDDDVDEWVRKRRELKFDWSSLMPFSMKWK